MTLLLVVVPINRLFEDEAFQPDHCRAMGEAFENVLNELRLKDRTDPRCEMIAKTIIDLGKQGVRNPTQIYILTMKALKD